MSKENLLSHGVIHPILKVYAIASPFNDFFGFRSTRSSARRISSGRNPRNFFAQQFPTLASCRVTLFTSTQTSMIGKCPQRQASGCPDFGDLPFQLRFSPGLSEGEI